MSIGECIVAIVGMICLTFLGICWIYEKHFRGDDN